MLNNLLKLGTFSKNCKKKKAEVKWGDLEESDNISMNEPLHDCNYNQGKYF